MDPWKSSGASKCLEPIKPSDCNAFSYCFEGSRGGTEGINFVLLQSSFHILLIHAMVQGKNSFAVQFYSELLLALSSVKEGDDAFSRIGVALDSLGRQKPTPDSGSTRQHRLTSTSPELSLIGGASMCTERQYPPSEVAQILYSALRSLQPSCPQNLGVYREIQIARLKIITQDHRVHSPTVSTFCMKSKPINPCR
ncbi:hypothetical protein LguiA_007670 [Lonicera macranthoides]